MAITKGAKKAQRQSLKRKVFNDRRKLVLKKNVKEVVLNVKAGDKVVAEKNLPLAYKALDKAVKTGVIKKGTADRKKSRLAKSIAKIV
jgi:small subunit ribosomal protein S20